jgi:hypothetical protein
VGVEPCCWAGTRGKGQAAFSSRATNRRPRSRAGRMAPLTTYTPIMDKAENEARRRHCWLNSKWDRYMQRCFSTETCHTRVGNRGAMYTRNTILEGLSQGPRLAVPASLPRHLTGSGTMMRGSYCGWPVLSPARGRGIRGHKAQSTKHKEGCQSIQWGHLHGLRAMKQA